MKQRPASLMAALIYSAFMCMSFAAMAEDFISSDMKIFNADDSISLAGTLTAPAGNHPKSVVILASGSGAQNRDEEIMGHRPFKTIAEYLSGNGYAVLRMDDRGTGESEGDFAKAVTDDFVTDISAAIACMRKIYADVPVGVIGHSEGGIVAIKSAVQNSGCDFIITLAAPAWSGDSIIMSQMRALATGLTGKWDGEAQQREILDIVKSDLTDMQVGISLSFLLNRIYGSAATLPEIKSGISKQVETLTSPWYRGMIKYDPARDIRNVHKPWLALNGDRDTQVLPANLLTIKELNPAACIIELKNLNHLFQRCITGLPTEYASIQEDISPEALEAMLLWLDSNVAAGHDN